MPFETGRSTTADASKVQSRGDFADFLLRVLADYRDTGAAEWENPTLERFLDGLSAFADSRVVDRDPASQETPTWGLFADMIVAATRTRSTRLCSLSGRWLSLARSGRDQHGAALGVSDADDVFG